MPRSARRRAKQAERAKQAPASTTGLSCVVDTSGDTVLSKQACRDIAACNAELLQDASDDLKTLLCLVETIRLHHHACQASRRALAVDAKHEYMQVYEATLAKYAYIFDVCLVSFPRGTPTEKHGMAIAVAEDGLEKLGCFKPGWVNTSPNVANQELQHDFWACLRVFFIEYSGLSPL